MRTRGLFLINLLIILLLIGCNSPSPPDNKEPVYVLNNYLEGLRDHDFKKIKQLVNSSVYHSLLKDEKGLEEMFSKQEQSFGVIKKWDFESDPYIDAVNNQAIIRTRVTTDKFFYVIDFDLRKEDKWRIYGTKVINKSTLKKESESISETLTDDSFDMLIKDLSKSNYHNKSK